MDTVNFEQAKLLNMHTVNVQAKPRPVIGKNEKTHKLEFLPRVIRANKAPVYLGMDRNRFNREVKPHLIAVPIGEQGIGYDRLDLDAWWVDYKSRNGQPGALCNLEGEEQWEKECLDSTAGRTSRAVRGTSTKLSTTTAFAKVVEQVTKKKRKGS